VQQKSFSKVTPAKKVTTTRSTKKIGAWKKNQVVLHKTFGMGVVKAVEQVGEETYFLTIFFKSGEKRIASRFVQKK